jgi:cytoskeleton protein RodZ
MPTNIGPTLRDARMRREIDLDSVEQETKIRARYLRALENEEWDVLPEGPYARSFIRTYANFLGLDGERLAEEFRLEGEGQGEERPAKAEPAIRSALPGRTGPRISRGLLAVLISVLLIGLLIVLGLTSGSSDNTPEPTVAKQGRKHHKKQKKQKKKQAAGTVTVKLTAIADVWVCLVDGKGQTLVNGQILGAGADSGPYHSNKFDVRFGNGQVAVQLNGKETPIANSSSPVGYELTAKGAKPLPVASQPTCA